MKRYTRIILSILLSILLSWALCFGFMVSLNAQTPAPAVQPQSVPPSAAPSDDVESRIFDVKNANLRELQAVLSIFGAQMNISDSLHVISVRARKEIMPAIEDAIKRLDVAPPPPPIQKAVELTIYVLRPADQQGAGSIPAALQPALNQLKNVFAYKAFELLETQFVRGTDGGRGVSTSGNLPGLAPLPSGAESQKLAVPYNFSARFRLRTTERNTPALLLENMSFDVKMPNVDANGNVGYRSANIQSEVEIPFGQQVVVGKTTVGESALILVMSAKFPD